MKICKLDEILHLSIMTWMELTSKNEIDQKDKINWDAKIKSSFFHPHTTFILKALTSHLGGGRC
jgi:hypothetical protein